MCPTGATCIIVSLWTIVSVPTKFDTINTNVYK